MRQASIPHLAAARASAVRSSRLVVRSSSGSEEGSTSTAEPPAATAATEKAQEHAAASNGNGAAADAGDAPAKLDFSALPEAELVWQEPSSGQKAATAFKLAFALPW